jgi:hypothetical protein
MEVTQHSAQAILRSRWSLSYQDILRYLRSPLKTARHLILSSASWIHSSSLISLRFCTHFFSLPCLLHTDYEASHYADFSIFVTTSCSMQSHFNPLQPSGHYMYCTTGFNQQFHVLPTQCIYVFVWIWEQTAIISLYNINWLVYITETESVYCAVRTGSLYIIQENSG